MFVAAVRHISTWVAAARGDPLILALLIEAILLLAVGIRDDLRAASNTFQQHQADHNNNGGSSLDVTDHNAFVPATTGISNDNPHRPHSFASELEPTARGTIFMSIGVIVIIAAAMALRAMNKAHAEVRYFVATVHERTGSVDNRADSADKETTLDAPARKMPAATAQQQWLEACAKRLATLGMWASLVTVVCMCAREITTVWVFPIKESDLGTFLRMVLTGTALLSVSVPDSLTLGVDIAYCQATLAVERALAHAVRWVAVRNTGSLELIAERGFGGPQAVSKIVFSATPRGSVDLAMATAAAHDKLSELLLDVTTYYHGGGGGTTHTPCPSASSYHYPQEQPQHQHQPPPAKPYRSKVTSVYRTVHLDLRDANSSDVDDAVTPSSTSSSLTLFVDLDAAARLAIIRVDEPSSVPDGTALLYADIAISIPGSAPCPSSASSFTSPRQPTTLPRTPPAAPTEYDYDAADADFATIAGQAVAQLVFECHRASARVAVLSDVAASTSIATIGAVVAIAVLQAVASVTLFFSLSHWSLGALSAAAATTLAPSPLTPFFILSLGLVGDQAATLVLTSVGWQRVFEPERIVGGAACMSRCLRRAVVAASLTAALWIACGVAPLTAWIRCHTVVATTAVLSEKSFLFHVCDALNSELWIEATLQRLPLVPLVLLLTVWPRVRCNYPCCHVWSALWRRALKRKEKTSSSAVFLAV